jgi:NDP-sugar pyrophosphorylase family protein
MTAPTALILAGGMGTRLRSAVADRPKALALIKGRPFLAWQLDGLARQGVRRVVLCTHYMSEMIEASFPPGLQTNGMEIIHSREPEPLGTGGALRLALDVAGEGDEEFLALNGDSFCAVDLPAFMATHHRHHAAATLLLAKVEDVGRYGAVDTDATGHITAFREKDPGRQDAGWINAGTYLLSRHILQTLSSGEPSSLERDLFARLVGHGLYGHKTEAPFLDIGTPESYAEAESYVQENQISSAV